MNAKVRFMVFFIVVLAAVVLVNLYLFYRTRPLFLHGDQSCRWFPFLFWFIAFSYLLGRVFERTGLTWIAEGLVKAGSWWLGAMVYLTLLFLLVDIVRGISFFTAGNSGLHFIWMSEKGRWVAAACYLCTFLILVAGYINALNPVVRKHSVYINKAVPGGVVKAVVVSDIHLGIMISNGRLEKLVELMNRQNADVILMAGDIFDEDLGPVIKNNLGDLLKNLHAREGVFAILGNHEFYGNAEDATQYLEDHHIRVLRDSAVMLPSGVVIAGREEITGERMFRKKRKSLQTLLANSDATGPVIVMDHQPYHLSEVAKSPVDLQVSGHTHHGQLWPFNFITKAMFEISAGYGKIGNTHFYVSPGVGTWGPPIRTSGRPEVIVLEITGK